MPGWEQMPQMPASQNRLRQAGARIVAVLAAAGQAPGIWMGDGLAEQGAGKAATVAASARRSRLGTGGQGRTCPL